MSVITTFRLGSCACGHLDTRSWPYAPREHSCTACGAVLVLEVTRESFRAYVPSTSRKRFQPHFNRSLGMHIESPEHFEAMKQRFGAMETDMKPGAKCDGGVPESVPRDWFAQTKRAHDVVEQTLNDPGVIAEAEADAEEFANDPVTRVGFDDEAAA